MLLVAALVVVSFGLLLQLRKADESDARTKQQSVRETFFGGNRHKEIPAGQKMAPKW